MLYWDWRVKTFLERIVLQTFQNTASTLQYLKARVHSFQCTTVKIFTIISSANLLKGRRDKRERRIGGENYGLKKNNPWREVFFIVTPTEYGNMSIWLCLHTQRHLSCWNALLYILIAKASSYPGMNMRLRRQEPPAQGPWQPQKGEKLWASYSCTHLSFTRQERETGKFTTEISGSFTIYKEAEWDIGSY